jgi:glycosyltransferase involved in cell wall biosynthesis
VLTSDNEGMPVSLIEAAMCGTPAVATRVGSVAEVVLDGRTGWLTDVSTDAVAAEVDRVLRSHRLLATAGEAAKAHAMRSFSRRRLVADTERLYDDIARQKGLTCG